MHLNFKGVPQCEVSSNKSVIKITYVDMIAYVVILSCDLDKKKINETMKNTYGLQIHATSLEGKFNTRAISSGNGQSDVNDNL